MTSGHADGDTWVPSECNTSIRPGWFYHESEDARVKSIPQLTDLYYRSVGHNGTFLLNFPVDKEGLIHPIDSANAVNYHQQVAAELSNNLLRKVSINCVIYLGIGKRSVYAGFYHIKKIRLHPREYYLSFGISETGIVFKDLGTVTG